MSYGNYEFRYVRGHIEVFLNGVFQFSADTVSEAQEELQDFASYYRMVEKETIDAIVAYINKKMNVDVIRMMKDDLR